MGSRASTARKVLPPSAMSPEADILQFVGQIAAGISGSLADRVMTPQGSRVAFLNDLWEFSPTTKEWAWMSGSNTPGAIVYGVYGTQGVASASNVPGARK